MYIDYLYNRNCECATLMETPKGDTFATLPTGKVKRFRNWSEAVSAMLRLGFTWG